MFIIFRNRCFSMTPLSADADVSPKGDNFNKVETLRVAQSDKQSFTVLPVFVLPSSRRLL